MNDFLYEMPVFEMSSEAGISGRRFIKVILHEIHADETQWQGNGVSWNEQYTADNMQSVVGMSIVAEFLGEDRDMPHGHGLTSVRDNMPLFENATMVGHFNKAYIDSVEINGETKRVLIGEGTLDEMRYPKFVEWLMEHRQKADVKGSVEITGKPEHDNHIIYADGWKQEGRVPKIYDYSGYAILGIRPADEAAIVMELNNKHEEELLMDEKVLNELKSSVVQAITETNSKNDEYENTIGTLNDTIEQLNGDLAGKDNEIAELNSKIEGLEGDIQAKNGEIETLNAEIANLKNEKAINELNSALSKYSEEEQKYAEEEIAAFKANPGSVEINSIVGKICTKMVEASREAAAEINSMIDIFAMPEEKLENNGGEDVEIF